MRFNILSLIPPSHSDTSQNNWQKSITVAVIILIGLNVVSGFALAASAYKIDVDNKSIKQDIYDLKTSLKTDALFTKILMMRTRFCEAQKLNLREQTNDWSNQLLKSLAEYRLLTKADFPMFNPC